MQYYPYESPGGWNILGRTPLKLFDNKNKTRPCLLSPGDTIKFKSILKRSSIILKMSKGFFQVIRPGINTTFQDQGRFNLQHYGLPPGGCMDYKSFVISNALVQNKKNEGVIEFAYQGPLLKLQEGNTKIAITGDVQFMIITANNDIIKGECYRSYNLNAGDQIDIQSTKNSVYGYLSVEGGFRLEYFFK